MDRTRKTIDVGDGKTMVVARERRMETAGGIETHCCKPNGATRSTVGLDVVFGWEAMDQQCPTFGGKKSLVMLPTNAWIETKKISVGASTHVASRIGMGKPHHKRTRKQKKDAHLLPILLLSHNSHFQLVHPLRRNQRS